MNARDHMRRGAAAARQNDLQGAWQAYVRATEVDPQCAPGWCNRAGLAWILGRTEEANTCYEQATHLAPSLAEPRLGLARIALSRRHWDRALEGAHDVLRLSSSPEAIAEARYLCGIAWEGKGDPERAVEEFEEAAGAGHDQAGKAVKRLLLTIDAPSDLARRLYHEHTSTGPSRAILIQWFLALPSAPSRWRFLQTCTEHSASPAFLYDLAARGFLQRGEYAYALRTAVMAVRDRRVEDDEQWPGLRECAELY